MAKKRRTFLQRIFRSVMWEEIIDAMDKWEQSFLKGDTLVIEGDPEYGGISVTWNGKFMGAYDCIGQFFLEDGGRRP